MGNGGAMRVAPLGAYFADDLDEVAEQAGLGRGDPRPLGGPGGGGGNGNCGGVGLELPQQADPGPAGDDRTRP